MKVVLVFISLLVACAISTFAESPFRVVMYDDKTEQELGAFPPRRSLWAKTVDTLRLAGARAVVLKFFFDLPSTDDGMLAQSIAHIPVFLQACFNEAEPSGNALDARFSFVASGEYPQVLSGNRGWLPVPVLAAGAHGVGFVDYRDIDYLPLIERYDGSHVRSLYFAVLQYVLPELNLQGTTLVNGNINIALNARLEMRVRYPQQDTLEYVSLADLLQGRVNLELFKDKVVIIGWDGKRSPTIDSPAGKLKTHRIFLYGLFDMYEQLREK